MPVAAHFRADLSTLGLGHVEWDGRCPSHERYLMTCDDFEDLWLRSGGRCALCGVAHSTTRHNRRLHIDHDAGRGEWAVRGLLCYECNTGLPYRKADPAVVEYLARPWYLLMLARRGVKVRIPPEPPIGGVVTVGRMSYQRYADGWRRWLVSKQSRDTLRSWRWLYHHYGPHNLDISRATGYTAERVRQICREAGVEAVE